MRQSPATRVAELHRTLMVSAAGFLRVSALGPRADLSIRDSSAYWTTSKTPGPLFDSDGTGVIRAQQPESRIRRHELSDRELNVPRTMLAKRTAPQSRCGRPGVWT